MRIAVTGSSGRIGRYVAQELVNAGHQVVGLDVQHDTQAKGGQLLVDLTDAGQVFGALAGCEAVVHMGAWANPGVVPDTRTYADNVTGTFNLLQAAADLGSARPRLAANQRGDLRDSRRRRPGAHRAARRHPAVRADAGGRAEVRTTEG